jgi:hypothetical protein
MKLFRIVIYQPEVQKYYTSEQIFDDINKASAWAHKTVGLTPKQTLGLDVEIPNKKSDRLFGIIEVDVTPLEEFCGIKRFKAIY